MQNVGYAALQIIPSFKGLEKNLEAGTSKAMLAAGVRGGGQFGDAAGKSAGQRFGRMFATTAKAGLLGVGALGALAFKVGKDSVGLASDLNESLNAVNVTYEEQAKAVKKLGREAADSLGLSNTEFNGLAVQFSAFATQVAGGEGPKVVDVLEELTTRGADFASVMNLEVNEAMGLFQSGLAGETEPLRKFGIDLSAAAVQAHAYKEGIAKTGEELTETEKVQARYSLLMKQTTKTAGDFANTSDSLANRQRILSARWDDARAKLGRGLLPMLTEAAGFLLDKGIPAFEDFSDWFVDKGIPKIQDFIDEAKPIAKDLLPEITDALKTVGGFAKDAAGYADDLIGAFNDMPGWVKSILVGGGAAAIGAKKLGLGGALAKGGSSLISRATPVPVFVTNPGFGAGGDLPGGGKTGKAAAAAAVTKTGVAAAAVAALSTLGIHKLSGKVAPEQTERGNFGSPQGMGTGLAGAGFLQDLDKKSSEVERFAGTTEAAVAKMAAATAKLPQEVQTHFITEGVPQSRAEAIALAKQYDLTPRKRDTLFEAIGIPKAREWAGLFRDDVETFPKKSDTRFSVLGIEVARSGLRNVKGDLDSLRDKTVTVRINTVRTDSSGADFISGGARKQADGGLILGPGGPRDDRIPAWLSNGEFVVNAAATARFLPLLRRINAQKYADGGVVGAASGGRSVTLERPSLAGLRIEGQMELTDGGAYLRGVIRDEIDADRDFERVRGGGRG